MKFAAFITLRLPSIVLGLAGAKLSKILSCLWNHILVQLHLDPPQLLPCLLMSVVRSAQRPSGAREQAREARCGGEGFAAPCKDKCGPAYLLE
jgi:hypothetical protein